jgi:hypothetical protein
LCLLQLAVSVCLCVYGALRCAPAREEIANCACVCISLECACSSVSAVCAGQSCVRVRAVFIACCGAAGQGIYRCESSTAQFVCVACVCMNLKDVVRLQVAQLVHSRLGGHVLLCCGRCVRWSGRCPVLVWRLCWHSRVVSGVVSGSVRSCTCCRLLRLSLVPAAPVAFRLQVASWGRICMPVFRSGVFVY